MIAAVVEVFPRRAEQQERLGSVVTGLADDPFAGDRVVLSQHPAGHDRARIGRIGRAVQADRRAYRTRIPADDLQTAVDGELLRDLGQHAGRAVRDELLGHVDRALRNESAEGFIQDRIERFVVVDRLDQLQERLVVQRADLRVAQEGVQSHNVHKSVDALIGIGRLPRVQLHDGIQIVGHQDKVGIRAGTAVVEQVVVARARVQPAFAIANQGVQGQIADPLFDVQHLADRLVVVRHVAVVEHLGQRDQVGPIVCFAIGLLGVSVSIGERIVPFVAQIRPLGRELIVGSLIEIPLGNKRELIFDQVVAERLQHCIRAEVSRIG